MPDWVVIPGGNFGNARAAAAAVLTWSGAFDSAVMNTLSLSALGGGLLDTVHLGLIGTRRRIAVAQAARTDPLYLAYTRGFDQLEPVFARPAQATAIKSASPPAISAR